MGKFGSMALASYDDIFSNDRSRGTDDVINLRLSELVPYDNQPFKVFMDTSMDELKNSIRNSGVLSPIIVRPYKEAKGKYEILSGHRRVKASKMIGLTEIPAVVKELDDSEAQILLVDSNLHRETLLPSEKAFAYKMKLEAMKRIAGRPKNNSKNNFVQVGQNSRQELAEQSGESSAQIQRYIRLTSLVKPLLDMTDAKRLAFNTAVELSYLTEQEQEMLADMIEELKAPSMAQASKMHKFSIAGKLDDATMRSIMSEKKPGKMKVTLSGKTLEKYFPSEYSAEQIEGILIGLLNEWKGSRI